MVTPLARFNIKAKVLSKENYYFGREYISKKKLSLNSGGSQSKLNEAQGLELVEHLSENSYLICSEICPYVHSKYGVLYTVSGMTDWLHSHRFSYKKPKPQPSKADPQKHEAHHNCA